MNYKRGLNKKVYSRGITIKFEKRANDQLSITKPSFFDALQHVNSPFEKVPRTDLAYQDYPLCQEVTLSLFEKGIAKTSIKYDPHQEKITIEEIAEDYQLNKGEALITILEHIMINHGNYHSFFIVRPKEWAAKRKATTP